MALENSHFHYLIFKYAKGEMKFITRISFTGHLLETHTSVNPHGVKKKKKASPILVVCPLWNTPWERKEEVHIHLQPTSIMPTCQIQTIQTHTHACTHAHPRRAWSFCQLCLLRLTESLWESLDKIRMKYLPLPFSFTVTFAGWVQVAGVGLGH